MLLHKGGPRDHCRGSVPQYSGLLAWVGPQVSLFPGEQSPEGEEDMGENQEETVATKKELGDINESGIQRSHGDGGSGQMAS